MSPRLGCGALSWAEKRRGGFGKQGTAERDWGGGAADALEGSGGKRGVSEGRGARGHQSPRSRRPQPSTLLAAPLTLHKAFPQSWTGTWYSEAYMVQDQDEG